MIERAQEWHGKGKETWGVYRHESTYKTSNRSRGQVPMQSRMVSSELPGKKKEDAALGKDKCIVVYTMHTTTR